MAMMAFALAGAILTRRRATAWQLPPACIKPVGIAGFPCNGRPDAMILSQGLYRWRARYP
jgi:hypothetical protein